MKISVAMITFNGEKKIEKTLKAVYGWADEIVTVDSHSKDKTVEISKKYGAKVYDEDWKGEGAQYKSVVDKCKNDWVLLLDQDEVLTEELKRNIEKEFEKEPKYKVYRLRLVNNIFGQFFYYGDKFYKKILFNKKSGGFEENKRIHVGFQTDEKFGKIKGYIEHYTYESIDEYFEKFNLYSKEGAEERYKKRKKAGLIDIFFRPLFKFLKNYIFKLGFLNGMEGFIFEVFVMFYTFTMYLKLRELYKNEKNKE